MTGEEMERAIEFILQNQATLEERLEQTQQQIAETSRIMQMHAETQTEFIKIVTKAIGDLAEAQGRTNDRVDRLAATVERFISEGRNGKV
jgi:prefoldin subunit 5